jgi:hypothetical protein
MPKMIVTHPVVDLDRWLAGKAERAGALQGASGRNVTDHVALDGSNNIAVSFEVDDVGPIQEGLAAPPPEWAALMEKHGVLPPFAMYVQAD